MEDRKYGVKLTEGKVSRQLIIFALPFLLSNIIGSLYSAVDLFVIGRYANAAAVSAVSTGGSVIHIVYTIAMGMFMGATILIGRSIGAKDNEMGTKAMGTHFCLGVILTVLLTAFMLIFYDELVALMRTPPQAVEYAKQYVRICAYGIPFLMVFNVMSAVFRGLGNSTAPSVFATIGCSLNIVLDFILVGALKMEVAGAAIATIISQGFGCFASSYWMYRKKTPFPFSIKDLKIDKWSLGFIVKVGSPIALQELLVSISFMVITAIINTMGVIASAGVGVVNRILSLALLIPTSFGAAVATMTSQNIGAKRYDRARSSLRWGIGYSLIFAFIFFICAQLIPDKMVGIFTKEKDVIAAGADYLRAYSVDAILVSFVFCMNQYFSGHGKSFVSMAHSLIATFCVRLPFSILVSRSANPSLFTLGFAAPAASVLSIIICFIYLHIQNKRDKQEERLPE